jgi:hypothetical protein
VEKKATNMPASTLPAPSTVGAAGRESLPLKSSAPPPAQGEHSSIKLVQQGQKKPVLTASDKLTYRAILAGVATSPNIATVANRYPWQAKMAVEKLLDFASEKRLSIRIVSGRAPEGFYNDGCCALLEKCKKSGCSIRVLIWQKEPDGISSSLMKLADAGILSLRISGTDDNASIIPHFLLVGDRAFRQEAGHPPFTNSTTFTDTEPQVPARIDFDDSSTGKVLMEFFDKLWGAA